MFLYWAALSCPGMLRTLLCLLVLGSARVVAGGEVYDRFPDVIDAAGRYVIYAHGLIVEGDDPRPVSPEFGVYDFPAVVRALAAGGGFQLIAHHRPKNTVPEAYAETLDGWVRRLLAARVAPGRITLVGFSRGGQITALASSRLASAGINTAILAACSKGDLVQVPPIVLGGHLLSIYETTDVVGSCATLAARSHLASFEEVAITTGKKHGAFFQPLPEWLRPLRAWIDKTNR